MTDLEICNMALSFHGKSITQDQLTSESNIEAKNCALYLPVAKKRCISEFDWSFFTKKLYIDYSDSQEGFGYRNSFKLPYGTVKVIPQERNDYSYRVLNGRIYTNEEEPEVWGINEDCMEDTEYPEEFDYLVAFSLGFLLCSVLSPSDQILLQNCLNQFTWTKKQLVEKEALSNYRDLGTEEQEIR